MNDLSSKEIQEIKKIKKKINKTNKGINKKLYKVKKTKHRTYKKKKENYVNTLFITIIIIFFIVVIMYLYKRNNEGYTKEGFVNIVNDNDNDNHTYIKIVLELEKANNYEDRQQGLMFRNVPLHERQQEYNYHSQTQINNTKELKEYHHLIKFKQGMLFDYGESNVISMWMKNTFIPLDIIFLDSDYNVIHFHKNATPHSLEGLSSKTDAYYAIELNAGSIDDLNIGVGDNIKEWIKIIDELD
jgi:uncharacterized membrane protein (UPF0127 family)